MAPCDYLRLHAARFKAPEQWATEGGDLCLVFLELGTAQVVARAPVQPLEPGDVLAVSGMAGLRVAAQPGKEVGIQFFSLGFEQLSPLFASKEFALLRRALDDFKRVKLFPAASPLAAKCHHLLQSTPPEYNLAHRSHLLRIAAAVLSEEFASEPTPRPGFVRMDEQVAQWLKRLSLEEILELSVGEFAARFHCSRRQLNRIFHAHFGSSVIALRMEMRLLRAASLLRDPDTKVLRVAEESGFNHQGLFNTCFKRRFGLSPGEWRKKKPEAQGPLVRVLKNGASCGMLTAGLCPWSNGGAQSKSEGTISALAGRE